MWCTACNGLGEIGGDEPRPWIKTSGPLGGGVEIYDTTSPVWSSGPDGSIVARKFADLERRVARLETMQRRKPKRKAGR